MLRWHQSFCLFCFCAQTALPKAHTCFNQLVLPQYTDGKQLHDKLFFALLNTDSFQLA